MPEGIYSTGETSFQMLVTVSSGMGVLAGGVGRQLVEHDVARVRQIKVHAHPADGRSALKAELIALIAAVGLLEGLERNAALVREAVAGVKLHADGVRLDRAGLAVVHKPEGDAVFAVLGVVFQLEVDIHRFSVGGREAEQLVALLPRGSGGGGEVLFIQQHAADGLLGVAQLKVGGRFDLGDEHPDDVLVSAPPSS